MFIRFIFFLLFWKLPKALVMIALAVVVGPPLLVLSYVVEWVIIEYQKYCSRQM